MNLVALFLASFLLLICITAGNICYREKGKKLYERAAIYRRNGILLMLKFLAIMNLPLVAFLTYLNFWATIVVLVLGILVLRKPLAKLVELYILLPVYLLLERLVKN